MLKKFFLYSLYIIIIYLSLYTILTKFIYINTFKTNILSQIPISQAKKNDVIGYISIPSISLKKNIYDIYSEDNDVDKNVVVLKKTVFPDEDNSIVFLAAHSGNNYNSYFDKIKLLKKEDLVELVYKNIHYKYKVVSKEEIKKNGIIYGKRFADKEIVLTTCSDNTGKQLLVHGIMIN